MLVLCCFFVATVSTASPRMHTSPERQLQDNKAPASEEDEGVIDIEDEAAVMVDDKLEEEYQFDDASLMEDHFDSKDFLPPDGTNVPYPEKDPAEIEYKIPEEIEMVEKEPGIPEIVFDDFDAIAPLSKVQEFAGEVESDGDGMTEEVDVEEKANELVQEAEEDMTVLRGEETNGRVSGSTITKPVPIKTYSADKQKKWVAHGAIGTIIFGLLVPSAMSSAFFRDLIPGYWIYLHVFLNVTTFALTFFTVGIAFATLNGMGDASEGHLKETHHIVGLLLLLLVSFQTANGFLRPPREFITDDADDHTPGAIHRNNSKSLTTRTIWYLSHAGAGLLIFALGTYQVHSGMDLFSKRFGSTDWGPVYLGYIFLIVIAIAGGKIWLKCRERKSKNHSFEMQTSNGEFNFGDDNSSDLGSLNFRQV